MHKLDQRGSLLIPMIIVSVLLLGALGFGFWAYAGRQDYKNNVDAKIDEAVEAANEVLSIEKEAEFAEREKSPYRTYQGPASVGALTIVYPKTWSAHVIEKGPGGTVVDGYFMPSYVPDTSSDTSFALRFEILDQPYENVTKTYDNKVKTGKIQATAYRLPKVDSALGLKLTGEIDSKKTGTLVVLPMRDKTVRVWTEGQDFNADFNQILNDISFNQ